MKIRTVFIVALILIALGITIYFNLPKETITITELPPETLPAIMIP